MIEQPGSITTGVPAPAKPSSTPALIAVISLVGFAIVAIVLVAIFAPGEKSVEVIGFVLAVIVPTLAGLMALLRADTAVRGTQDVRQDVRDVRTSVQEVKITVDGRMQQLLELTAKGAHSEGVIEGATGVATTPPLPTVQQTLTVPPATNHVTGA